VTDGATWRLTTLPPVAAQQAAYRARAAALEAGRPVSLEVIDRPPDREAANLNGAGQPPEKFDSAMRAKRMAKRYLLQNSFLWDRSAPNSVLAAALIAADTTAVAAAAGALTLFAADERLRFMKYLIL
jgi:hypothetical protein